VPRAASRRLAVQSQLQDRDRALLDISKRLSSATRRLEDEEPQDLGFFARLMLVFRLFFPEGPSNRQQAVDRMRATLGSDRYLKSEEVGVERLNDVVKVAGHRCRGPAGCRPRLSHTARRARACRRW